MRHDERAKKLRLYLICGEGDDRATLGKKVSDALAGGVTAVQLRAKTWDAREIYDTACELRKITAAHGALFIINDRLDIALAVGADGVHLGQKDLPVAEARKIAPRGFLVGGTARTVDLAKAAQRDGADYIGCGSAFPTGTKQDAVVIGPEGITEVLRSVTIPSVAIGGIDAENVERLAHCGCSGICLSGGIMKAPDPKAAAAQLLNKIKCLFESGRIS
ncbi:thiamine phosphate synthase [Synergistaceae bacterium OttesenSCG-928-D05]|nr:thiamine phosphate synthase [Synergistaceae bacterium OttesenSCG-928-D05]